MHDNINDSLIATVVITGGNRGIGESITREFLKMGYRVYVGSKSGAGIDNFTSPNLRIVKTDVRDELEVEELVRTAVNETGRLDVFINNAGYSEWRPIAEIDPDFLEDIIKTNLMGAFWGAKAAAKAMTNGGCIINMSSIAGKRGSANNSAYVATKFGMNGLTQSLAKELGSKNIRVNGVCPVLIPTSGLMDALTSEHSPVSQSDTDQFFKKFAEEQSALKRLPLGSEVAKMCTFLASGDASAVTGQNINVDCGVFPQ